MSNPGLCIDEGPVYQRARHRAGVVGDIAVIATAFLLLGALGGLMWWLLVEPAMFTKVGGRGSMSELELSKRFDTDGWYAVIALVSGVLAGGLLTWWRSRDLLATTTLLVGGSCLAAAVMAGVGFLLGPEHPDAALAAARPGERVPVQLVVTAKATYLTWPISVLVGALLVLWSPPRDGE